MNSFSLADENGGVTHICRKTPLRPKSTVQGVEEKWMFYFKIQHTFKITKLFWGGLGWWERGDTWFYPNILFSVSPQKYCLGVSKRM